MPLDTDFLADSEDIAHLSSPLAMRKKVKAGFRTRTHQKVISDAVVDAVSGRGPRFVGVSIGQQQGKTEITSIGTPEWIMELHSLGVIPGGLCALMSYEDALPMSWSMKIRREIEATPDLFFSKLRKDSRAASYWETEQGGGIIAVGSAGSLQGRPITFLGIDDPTKSIEQALSPTHQDKLWNHWLTVLYGRLQPWSTVLVTMARMAPDDFIGRLMSRDYEGDPEDWRFISIPYVAVSEDDPLGREIGDPLIRPQADQTLEEAKREAIQVQKSISTYAWQAMWQQDPRDAEGTIFPESKWRFWGGDLTADERFDLPSDFEQLLFTWDMAFKDFKTSDWVVGGLIGRNEMDYYLLELVRGRWSFTETCTRVNNFAVQFRARYPKATTVVVEDKANGPAIMDALRSRVGGLVEFNPGDYGSKLARAWAVQPYLLGGNIYIPAPSERPWVRTFMKELGDFRGVGNETDDQVDCLTMGILYMQKFNFAPSVVASPADLDDNLFQTRFTQSRRSGII